MANHKSAIKRNRQNIRKNQRNKQVKGSLRSALKDVRNALSTGGSNVKELAVRSERAIAKAATKGILKKKTASRIISRMTKKVKAATK